MGNETELFKLDLDASSFIEGAGTALSTITKLGDGENLSGLIGSLAAASAILGPLVAVAGTMKEAFDMTLQAESIAAVNVQFTLLSDQAGISSEQLKTGLMSATAGLASETEVLKSANKEIVLMGENASRLPEIMELARKYTAVFGGNLIDNFENMGRAISMGNQRMLKHMGIVIDTKSAHEKYAAQLGVSVSSLSAAAQKQAVFNEAMESGQKAFQAVDPELKQATNAWERFKTQIKETAEAVTLGVGSSMKDGFVAMINYSSDGLSKFTRDWNTAFGKESQNQIDLLNFQLKGLQAQLVYAQEHLAKDGQPGILSQVFLGKTSGKEVSDIEDAIHKIKDQIAGVNSGASSVATGATAGDASKGMGASSPAGPKADEETLKKDLLEREKILERIAKMDEQSAKSEIAHATSIAQVNKVAARQKEDIEIEFNTKIRMLREDDKKSMAMVAQEEVELAREKDAQIKAIDDSLQKDRLHALDNLLLHNKTVYEGIANAAKSSGQKANIEMNDFGQLGKARFDSFQTHAVAAFKAIGDGSENAASAMGKAFAGMLGDMATQKGQFMMLDAFSLGFNAPEFAAGAGLVALGGLLGSLGGGGGGAASASTPSGGGSAAIGQNSSVTGLNQPTAPRQGVTVQISGNYYDTAQTQQALMDVIRNATDQTDFRYVQVGGT